ncbi:hypothetical protein AHF37_12683 [Paragonimus kellicotti]|nr:hypothetical protein AHF37_12683 [Paragonimus kellicotti]
MALMCEEIRPTFFSSIQTLGDFTDYNFQTFVACSQILLDFLTLWGSRFYIVKSDVDGNIKVSYRSLWSSVSEVKTLNCVWSMWAVCTQVCD